MAFPNGFQISDALIYPHSASTETTLGCFLLCYCELMELIKIRLDAYFLRCENQMDPRPELHTLFCIYVAVFILRFLAIYITSSSTTN